MNPRGPTKPSPALPFLFLRHEREKLNVCSTAPAVLVDSYQPRHPAVGLSDGDVNRHPGVHESPITNASWLQRLVTATLLGAPLLSLLHVILFPSALVLMGQIDLFGVLFNRSARSRPHRSADSSLVNCSSHIQSRRCQVARFSL